MTSRYASSQMEIQALLKIIELKDQQMKQILQENNFMRLNVDAIERIDEPDFSCHIFRQHTSRDDQPTNFLIDRISHAESLLRKSDSNLSLSSKRGSKQRKATAKTQKKSVDKENQQKRILKPKIISQYNQQIKLMPASPRDGSATERIQTDDTKHTRKMDQQQLSRHSSAVTLSCRN